MSDKATPRPNIWPTINLIIEGREDGGIRLRSPNVLGLVLSTGPRDRSKVMAEVPELIDILLAKNGYTDTDDTIAELVGTLEEARESLLMDVPYSARVALASRIDAALAKAKTP